MYMKNLNLDLHGLKNICNAYASTESMLIEQ